jgi:hypothetical protein
MAIIGIVLFYSLCIGMTLTYFEYESSAIVDAATR